MILAWLVLWLCTCVCTGDEALRLIFADKVLDADSSKLSEYGIQQHSVIQMVMKVPGGLTVWRRPVPDLDISPNAASLWWLLAHLSVYSFFAFLCNFLKVSPNLSNKVMFSLSRFTFCIQTKTGQTNSCVRSSKWRGPLGVSARHPVSILTERVSVPMNWLFDTSLIYITPFNTTLVIRYIYFLMWHYYGDIYAFSRSINYGANQTA